jgi:hypothetical protein
MLCGLLAEKIAVTEIHDSNSYCMSGIPLDQSLYFKFVYVGGFMGGG